MHPKYRAAALALTLAFACLYQVAGAEEKRSLYQRLGGYDAIAAVVDRFANRLFDDPKLDAFFGGMSLDTQKKFIHHNIDLVCSATGGPCSYLGRSMPEAHSGIGIDGADFEAVAAHLSATLDSFSVPKREKDELLAIIGGLRPQIVETR